MLNMRPRVIKRIAMPVCDVASRIKHQHTARWQPVPLIITSLLYDYPWCELRVYGHVCPRSMDAALYSHTLPTDRVMDDIHALTDT